ncbi:MAG: DUF5667 domain-containing protein [Actinomycetota bacterium]
MSEKDRKNKIDKKTKGSKVIKKFLNLLDKGYSFDYCLDRFSPYKNELEPYLNILKDLKNPGNIKNNKKLEDSILEKVYKSNIRLDKIYGDNYDIRKIRVRPAFLKPVIVFLSIFMFFSLSFAGTIYASANSLPGDVLYNVKRTYEDVQIVFTPYANEGKLYFNFLNKRIYEADALLDRDDIDKETIENLLGEIDYNYAKCMEHNSFGENEGERIGKNINGLRETFQKRWHNSPNSNGQKANDGNQNMEQQQNSTTQNIEQQIDDTGQNLEQYQDGNNQNMNQQHNNNSQDTGTPRFIKKNI